MTPNSLSSGCASHRLGNCGRREAIRIGFCGALGLSMADLLRWEARAAIDPGFFKEGKAKSIIHLHLPGGLAQQESWDPKPEAPAEYRGAFGVAKTNTGEIFSENLPRLAKVADKITVVRSVVGKIPDHQQATYHLFTGYIPTTVIDYPQMGAVVSHLFGPRRQMPPYVAIPNSNGFAGGTGFLSSKYGAFQLNADPGGGGEFKVRDFSLPDGMSLEQFDRRKSAREIVESNLRALEADTDKLNTMDEFYRSAYTLLTSDAARNAFSLNGETDAMRDLYGRDYKLKQNAPAAVGERLLLARRLVEAGVRFVTVTYGSWDSHVDIKGTCTEQMPALDHAISGLVTDLDQRGLLDSTLVMVTSEFGRTPKVNTSNGRDHWARVYSMMLAGGGITRGQIYGASDATSAEPARDEVKLEDFLCTAYHQLGIDSNEELMAFGGTRPIEIVKGGNVVQKIVA
ncbi:MAG TPA: DUF1501 domain-containing protein [Verrucomicrobiales bacterium]|nr:DUF1501 domain-containing protein [Verrucomicrobiae bacterium]MCP5554366.1 DUF1501 domain-containing protein [Akkermansiaceae bacterium]HRX54648.1 DUF1501 domain-containing protein [Verrucomicrobiales bacterium]